MAQATNSKEEVKKLARELSQSLAEVESVSGIHVMTIAWEEAIPEVIAPFIM